ncbi:hypothetical protein Btru_071387 [Bulinus truncatus]|nr:hypothetical protein Btru_071387 [Bulinus truncatus]
MDDIDSLDFWPTSPNYDDALADINIKLRDSPIFEPERPYSNMSILPSEDDMNFESLCCTYDFDQDVDMHPTLDIYPERQALNNIALDSYNYEHIKNKIFEKFSTPEKINGIQADVLASDSKDKASEDQLDKKESKKAKNRISAKRSRDRKKEDLETDRKKNQMLEQINKKLKTDVGELNLKLAYCKTVYEKQFAGIQEQNDEVYHITGLPEKVTMTYEDEEIVSIIDSMKFPGLHMKHGICSSSSPLIKEAQYDATEGFNEAEDYVDVNLSVSNVVYFKKKEMHIKYLINETHSYWL